MAGDQLVFHGVGYAESQDREDEHRTGVPSMGGAAVLLDAPSRRTSRVVVVNSGEEDAHIRLKTQGAVKTQAAEPLTALAGAGFKYTGMLQFKNIVPGSVVISNAGAPLSIVDDKKGVLYDIGFVGVAANKRGTINYVLGTFTLTYGAAPTEMVAAAYSHSDYTDFVSPAQATSLAAAAFPFVMKFGFGRVNPFSVAMVDGGPKTFVDDGKGNIIETTAGSIAKVGTIDYALGIVTLTTASAALAGTMAATYTFNPFAALLVHAGGTKDTELMPGAIPELSSSAWAGALRKDSIVGLHGESRGPAGTNLITRWSHYSEDPYRVRELFSGFPPGGQTNDPRFSGQTPFSS